MKAIVILLTVLLFAAPVAADPPRAGSYVGVHMYGVIGIALTPQGKGNFTVAGAFAIDGTNTVIKGTLSSTNNQLKGEMVTPKGVTVPLQGFWDPAANELVVLVDGARVSLKNDLAANSPKPGTYLIETGDYVIAIELTPHPNGNFSATGAIKQGKQQSLLEGTLYSRTNRLAVKASDMKGTSKAVNGFWNPSTQKLVIVLDNLQFPLTRDSDGEKEDKAVNFTGTWETNYGPMTLSQSGSQVTGSYVYQGGHVENGTVSGSTLTFRWRQDGNKAKGDATINFAIDDKGVETFSGTWTSDAGGSGSWTGSKNK